MNGFPFVDSYLLILLETAVKSGLIVFIAWGANHKDLVIGVLT